MVKKLSSKNVGRNIEDYTFHQFATYTTKRFHLSKARNWAVIGRHPHLKGSGELLGIVSVTIWKKYDCFGYFFRSYFYF